MKSFSVRTVRDRNRLRLEWIYQGQRRTLYPGLADTKTNRIKAREIALQIEADIECGVYDISLSKYKKSVEPLQALSSTELFELWLQFKKPEWDADTFKIRSYLKSDLIKVFKNHTAPLTKQDIGNFYNWLSTRQLAAETFNRKLDTFEIAWEWLVAHKYTLENPWHDLPRRKVGKNLRSKPFSKKEIQLIIKTFETDKYYKVYTPFVKFLFGTGCRIGEGIGIRWGDVDLTSGKIIIAEQITRRKRKTAKANSGREFYLSASIKNLLATIKPIVVTEEDLIFVSPTGKPLDAHNFRERAWTSILESAPVLYRKPSNTRHTFCSHALEGGMNPITVASITGHDPKVLFDRYAGLIGKPEAPDIF